VKEAGLQNPVLTNRNGIRGRYTGISKHIIVTSEDYQNRIWVDVAGIGGKKMPLPGEVSKVTCNYMEKSAEVIVLTGNELGQYSRGLTGKEGPNVILFKIRIGMMIHSLCLN